MATILFIIIALAYIGLGVPDSLFGAAWPAMYEQFSIPVSYAGFVTALIYGGTIISSLLSAKAMQKFGTAKVTAASTALTAVALLGFSLSRNMIWLCLFAIPLGMGAGAVDAALNNYAAIHYKASHMSFLHCFYGVGVSISPYLMSLALKGSGGWQGGYRTVFFIQAAIAVIVLFSLPLWRKTTESHAAEGIVRLVRIPDILKIPAARASLLIFAGSCTIESVCLAWGSTFLVQSKGASPDRAAAIITLYFIGLTLGRFLSGVVSRKLSPKKILLIGEAITLAAIVWILLPLSPALIGIGLFCIGLGNGPVFPNMTYLTPIHFGKDVSQSFIGLQMTVSNAAFLLSPMLFGGIVQVLGTDSFAGFQIAAWGITAVSTLFMIRYTAKRQVQ